MLRAPATKAARRRLTARSSSCAAASTSPHSRHVANKRRIHSSSSTHPADAYPSASFIPSAPSPPIEYFQHNVRAPLHRGDALLLASSDGVNGSGASSSKTPQEEPQEEPDKEGRAVDDREWEIRTGARRSLIPPIARC